MFDFCLIDKRCQCFVLFQLQKTTSNDFRLVVQILEGPEVSGVFERFVGSCQRKQRSTTTSKVVLVNFLVWQLTHANFESTLTRSPLNENFTPLNPATKKDARLWSWHTQPVLAGECHLSGHEGVSKSLLRL